MSLWQICTTCWRPWILIAFTLGCITLNQVHAGQLNSPLDALSQVHKLSDEYVPGDEYMGIRLLGTLSLAPVEPMDLPMQGLSGLAFDEDENILYALSDNGRVYHLRPGFENNILKTISVLAAYRLLDAKGKPLKGRKGDSEGIVALHGRNSKSQDTELIISFERYHRIARYNPQGKLLETFQLPKRLANKNRYAKANRGIESVTFDPRFGLLAAPERPFKNSPTDEIEIIAVNHPELFWRYQLAPEPNAALVGIEGLGDGSFVTLERAHGSYFVPFITTIRHLPALEAGQTKPLVPRTLARFSTGQGWNLDNFEGLSRHTKNRFFMISDDNGKIYQSTLLNYFEVLEHEPHQRSQPTTSLQLTPTTQ